MAISPASPRWLIRDNQLDKARNILTRIRESKDEVDHEILEVQASLKSKNVGIKEVIKSYKPVLLTVAILAFFQVFTGINAVIFYTPMVFKGLNMPNAAVVADFAVETAFPSIFNTIGFNVFYILSVLSIAALIFVYFKIPETKGKSLEEIELFWSKKA